MRTDTLTYKYYYHVTPEQLFSVLIGEQLKFFQRFNPNIEQLSTGTTIDARLTPKMHNQSITNKMTIKEIDENKKFQLMTSQLAGDITQTFEFLKDHKGNNVLIYSEKNRFDSMRNQTNFILIGFIYKFFFNRGMRKKLVQLEHLA